MTEPTRPRDRLTAGYDKSEPLPVDRPRAPSRPDPGMEALAAMRTGDAARFERLVSSSQKISLGYYLAAKAEAEPQDAA